MHTIIRTSAKANLRRTALVSRTAAFIFAAAIATTSLHAQSTAPTSHPNLDLRASLVAPLNLIPSTPAGDDTASTASSASLSSSNDGNTADPELDAERLSLSDTNQPPPRRSYGRPRYSDRTHNADGSNKLAFVLGGGFTVPSGGTGHDLTLSYRFQAGAGYNFSKKFGVMAQFDYDHFGLPGSVIAAQQALYASLQISDGQGGVINVNGLDANSHIWSITLNPTYTFVQGERTSAYVVVGGGFYRKTVNFTLPTTGVYCDFYGFCYQVNSNQNFDTYTNGAGGVNGGLGFTYKIGRFANEKFFTEARYVWIDNQKASTTQAQGNYFPQANNRTGYFPVTVGIRW
jgi:hypothetical protein